MPSIDFHQFVKNGSPGGGDENEKNEHHRRSRNDRTWSANFRARTKRKARRKLKYLRPGHSDYLLSFISTLKSRQCQ
jgi:hypothetical protein